MSSGPGKNEQGKDAQLMGAVTQAISAVLMKSGAKVHRRDSGDIEIRWFPPLPPPPPDPHKPDEKGLAAIILKFGE